MPFTSNARLQAHALFITVILALIIGLFCTLLLMVGYNRMRIDARVGTETRLQRNLQSAIDLILADTTLMLSDSEYTLDLFGETRDTVIVKKKNWGLFDIASITAVVNGNTKTRSFFFGQAIDSPLDGCIWLAEHRTPLALAGNTRLKGNAHIPKGGLRPAIIDQRGFAFPELILGTTSNSGDSLPPVNPRLIGLISQETGITPTVEIQAGYAGPSTKQNPVPDSLDRSFGDTATILYGRGPINLSSCSLKGHILIISDSLIRVSPGAILENVILSAPVIRLDSGWSGMLQAIASDSIIVQNNCRLFYPSALVLLKYRGSTLQPKITIGDSCMLNGMILTHISLQKDQVRTYVEIGKGSILDGWLYAEGFVYLKGQVHGAVMADHFLYKTPMTVYVNYLVDATIDRTALSPWFAGPHIFNNDHPSRIVQWVH
ncbi:MAG TPA: hypothetical protein VNU72_12170 [Puia sp.]|jgi:hypothetical protein|nr:hypothetical protein [Puia sp.]